MKTLSNLLENFDSNPGNTMGLGVTNHLTPIFNIITTVRNLFGLRLGVVVEEGEDHVSIKLHSSKFTNPTEINRVLDERFDNQRNVGQGWNDCTLRSYITSQGLTEVKMVNLGQYYVVYFSPNDMRIAGNPDVMAAADKIPTASTPCKEMLNFNLDECELDTFSIVEALDDEELEDKSLEDLYAIIDSNNKIKGAEKLSEIVAAEIELPKEYYFKAVKDAEGNESIALRHKITKRRPFGKTAEIATSLMNIYKTGDDAIWVGAFDDDTTKDEERTLIENILKILHAKETKDNCVYSINGTEQNEPEEKEDKKEEENQEDKVNLADYKPEDTLDNNDENSEEKKEE